MPPVIGAPWTNCSETKCAECPQCNATLLCTLRCPYRCSLPHSLCSVSFILWWQTRPGVARFEPRRSVPYFSHRLTFDRLYSEKRPCQGLGDTTQEGLVPHCPVHLCDHTVSSATGAAAQLFGLSVYSSRHDTSRPCLKTTASSPTHHPRPPHHDGTTHAFATSSRTRAPNCKLQGCHDKGTWDLRAEGAEQQARQAHQTVCASLL
jgi:hypothetical protein